MFRSDLCDYSDTYIVVKGRISVTDTNNAQIKNKKLIFKNNAPFRSCILKINSTFIDNAEALDIVMPMDNLLAYSDNYCTAHQIIIRSTPDNSSRLDVEVVIQLKFWRSLDLPLINCETELDLS